MQLRRLVGLTTLLLVAACRQDVPLPEVSLRLDAAPRSDARTRPPEEVGGSPDAEVDTGQRSDAADGGSTCSGSVRQVFFRQFNPQVMLAVDRSASMVEKPADAPSSRWQRLQNALKPLFRTYHLSIHFGYVEFPASECRHGFCCWEGFLPPTWNYRAIESKWSCGGTSCPVRSDDSPAGVALYKSRQYFDTAEQNSGSRQVLLFTDGEPSCGGPPDVKACGEATSEIAELLNQHHSTTTVFALDPRLTTSVCLKDMALLGSEGPLHVAADEATLRQQLEDFLKPLSAEACTFQLREPLVPPQRLAVTAESITGDRSSIRRDSTRTDGWEFDNVDDLARFTVYGPWCDKLRESKIDDVDAYVCSQ